VEWVEPTAIVYTDEWPAYNQLGGNFTAHSRVRHPTGEYVLGTAHTNTVEGFFGHRKPSIRGSYLKVSHRRLQGYLNEFTFRYNERHSQQAMFRTLLARAANPS
jgi:transposase-like protein